MSKVIRTVKNVTKGYSSTQVKVRNATSNDPWGPTGTEMSEIAQMTFETDHPFFEIMDMLDKRLNDKGKNWRHVLKALKVLDYCLHEGSEHVVVWAKDNIYIIKTLREFQYIDEEGRDQGLNVRISAKELTSLINDEDRLRSERKDRKSWKSRVHGIEESASSDGYSQHREPPRRRERRTSAQRNRTDEEDVEYRLAIEASKNQAEEDRRRHESTELDNDLKRAIALSEEEEEARRRALEEQKASQQLLFDDASTPQPQQQQLFQPPSFQQDYQQLGQVDLFGNPVGQHNTGYLANVYSQPTGYMQQQQQYPQQMYSQPTGYEQIAYLNPMTAQPTGYQNGNPYSTTQFPSPDHTSFLQPGDNNPYANSYNTPQPLQPLPTGSNNPFAPRMNTPQSPPRTAPSLSTLQQQQQQQQYYSQQQQNNSFEQFSPPTTSHQQQPDSKPINPQHAHLEALLASGGDGLDTFGNVGNLRIPSQHTAPGTFVNSAGHGRRPIQAQNTGSNPFFNQQFTGVPQSTGFTNNLQPQPARLVPAHTGPAGLYGGYSQQQNNPFGQPQQQQQQQSAGNLIDF
ncbi:hypothetical protein RUND412_003650 [Rhizina undulata]